MSTRKSTVFYGFLLAFGSLVVGMVIASRLDLAPGSFAANLNVPATNSAPLTGSIDATTFRNIAKQAGPAVVSITVRLPRQSSPMEDLLGQMPGNPFGNGGGQGTPRRGRRAAPTTPEEQPMQEGAGSGFIIDKSGFILTNNHVVENATSINVQLSSMEDGEDGLPAKVVGRDPLADVALIQLTTLPKDPLVEAKFGDSDQMAPGDWVMAIGNPFRLSNTVTVGVVSAVGRQTPGQYSGRSQEMIQTDAAINRGNSGGPLLNVRGEVIGINSMIETEVNPMGDSSGNVGVGFAVPINTVRDLLPQLREGKVTRGKLGVGIAPRPLTPEYAQDLGLPSTNGAEVDSFEANSPAKAAGMRMGDVIVEFNGKMVKNNVDLVRLVTSTAPGTTVPVKVYRDKKPLTINVKVEELDLAKEQSVAEDDQTPGPPQPEAQPKSTGFGMSIQDLSPADRRDLGLPADHGGVLIAGVTPSGAAMESGLQEGDVILSIQGTAVSSAEEVSRILGAVPAGRTVRVVVLEKGDEKLFQLRKR